MTRQDDLAAIRDNPNVTVLIVGGGVNGIGAFWDLAHQGIDVLLVERGDFCSGASAASSHMVHGGLKYLENGEFRLVREAVNERNRLLVNAPHYVKPLPTTIPIFKWFSGLLDAPLKFLRLRDNPGERGAIVIKIGLMFYDFFTRNQSVVPNHRFLSRKSTLEIHPRINPSIICGAVYYDGWMAYPERICTELILDAEAASDQARAINYVSAVGADGDTVHLEDRLTGETLSVRPTIMINAAGPWIDFVNDAMQRETKFIGGTKGSHLVVDNPDLVEAIGEHEIYFENKDRRICLIFPFGDRVIIGSTDIRIDNPDEARCTEEEVDYMLESVKLVFPDIEVDRSQIVYRFSGVRPLAASDAEDVMLITRDHSIEVVEANGRIHFPILSLVGGKWTTFRAFAEQTTDDVLRRLRKTRQVSTRQMAIGGGRDYPAESEQEAWCQRVSTETGVPLARVETLFERYGTRAAAYAAFIAEADDTPLPHTPDYSTREVDFLARHEKIAHLDDLILRRSILGMYGLATVDMLHELAAVIGPVLGWSEARTAEEIERAAAILRDEHAVDLQPVPIP